MQVKHILNPPLCNQKPNNDKIAIERSSIQKQGLTEGNGCQKLAIRFCILTSFLPVQVSAH